MLTIQSINALNEYLNGVMDRANHHANNVNEVALTLAGAVMWRTTDDIEVRSNNNGGTGNMLWFHVDDNRFVLSYNHQTGRIDLIERSMQGRVRHSFDNSNTAIDVKAIFATL